MPDIAANRTHPHRFVPEDFEGSEASALSELYDKLEAREVSTRQDLENLLLDWDELEAIVWDAYSRAYVDMTADTTNPDHEALYLKIVETVLPVAEQRDFGIKRKILESPAVDDIGPEYAVLLRNIRTEVGIFREENVPLLTEDLKLGQEYEKIAGTQEAEFRGEMHTLPQLARFFEEPDAQTREDAWRVRAERLLADAPALDKLYDRMYAVRRQIAANAGFDSYRDYAFQLLKRFDYTPEDCAAFHDAIEKHVVPVVAQEWEERKRKLGVDTLRPWDAGVRPNDPVVDPDGRPALRPFDTVDRLKDGCERIVRSVDSELGDFFRTMMDNNLLDLDNRPGKAPGGYMTSFPDSLVPFIFMNAVGTNRDVDTMLHEGGHAFHYFLAGRLPLHLYHHTTSEFSEVASQGMELLARPYLGEFYTQEELARLLDDQLRSTLRAFPWIAMIDAFQHWVYTTPDQNAESRRAKWVELERRFRPGIDWSGLEQYREIGWQYPHVFTNPFYYVEYGIAQLAALQVWLNSLQDERGAVEAYKRALALGGSRPLPELFEAAGAEFAFDDRVVSALVKGTTAQLSK